MAINLDWAENVKIESCFVGKCYYIERSSMWGKYCLYGNYCPDTGEYCLHRLTNDEEIVLASCLIKRYGNRVDQSEKGYNYDVVRELLQLGHLTTKTLAAFVEAGGEVWWNQP